jgi:putative DNA primase/helicase
MAKIPKVVLGPWEPPTQLPPDPPEVQLHQAMLEAGLLDPPSPSELQLDGQIHRFKNHPKRTFDRSGWYMVHGDGVPAGVFGCWREGIEVNFKADIGRKMTLAEEMAFATRVGEARKLRDQERERKQETVADVVSEIWQHGGKASPDHPYLKRKGIGVHGAKVTGDGRLMLPLLDEEGHLATLQYIDSDGQKLYHTSGATKGKFWMLGTMDEPGTLYVAEGFATAATILEATKRPCVAAYSASNLVPVAGILRKKHPNADIVIVADNDESGVGQRYAEQASAKYGCRVILPPSKGDANDFAQEGGDLLALLAPPDSWLVSADSFAADMRPIDWIIKGWIQSEATAMIHGPSGSGKTFLVLDWALHVAAGLSEWMGHKIAKPGGVIYLAGEGHFGLKSRISAWKHHHNVDKLNMFISQDACGLDTPEGYQHVALNIRKIASQMDSVQFVIIDTLHRFLDGDENSPQDAKRMLDICDAIKKEFGCTIILIHHTGVSHEAQHRGRGSSAWKGALELELSVVPKSKSKPMHLVFRKSKDFELVEEPFYLELQQVKLPKIYDEDGNQVYGAVLQKAEPPQDAKRGSHASYLKFLEKCWWNGGGELRDGKPYVSRGAIRDTMVAHEYADATIKNYLKPSHAGGFICELLNAETIAAHEHGWVVIGEPDASRLKSMNTEQEISND